MTQNEIQAFLAVIQCGSLTGAAEKLHITQPTLSHRLMALENELGVTLIERRKGVRRAVLTESGEAFIPQAQKWESLWNETATALSGNAPKILTIATVSSMCSYILPEIYWRFAARKLSFRLNLVYATSIEAYRMIESGEADFAILSNTRFSPHAAAFPVMKEKMVFLCGTNSKYPPDVDPADLSADREIFIQWSNDYTIWHEYWFGLQAPSFIRTNSIPFLERFLDAPEAWAVVPFSVAEPMIQNGKAAGRNLKNGPGDRLIYLITARAAETAEYRGMLLQDIRSVIEGKPGFRLLAEP